MTPNDVKNLENSPPKINPSRKNVKIINKGAMEKFGSKAFKLQDADLSKSIDVHASKQKKEADSTYNSLTSKTRYESNKVRKGNETLSPRKKDLDSKREEIDKRKLLTSLNDLDDQLTKPTID
jgi:hypothetical protein